MPKKKSLTAKDWNTKIRRAKDVKGEWRKRFRIALAYEYWEGAQRPPGINENEWITINMIYSNLRAELPSLYQADPYFYVKLKKARIIDAAMIEDMETRARVRQSMINYLKGELNLKNKARLSIFDAEIQYGVIKVHYHADMVKNPDAGKPMTTEIEGKEVELVGLVEPDLIPANEAYKITRIHPDDFLVDEDAGPIYPDDCKWRAQRLKMPLEDVKNDRNYEAAARKVVKATELSDEAQKAREARKKGGLASSTDDVEPDTVILWEIYDLKNKQWLTLAEGCDEFMKKPGPLPPGTEGDPFVDLRFVARDDSWYPLPPVSQLLDSQREYCEARSKRMVHRKRFNRKYVLNNLAFDDPERAATDLENGEDGTIIRANQAANIAVQAIQDAPLDQQEALEYNYLRQDFQDLAVGPNQRGSTQGVDSATEAGILEKRAVIQEGDKLGLVMDFLINIARKVDQLVQAHLTEDQAVKVAGPTGEMVWQTIRAADYGSIAGEYEYSVNVGAETPQLPEIERAQFNAVLQLFANAPQLLLSRSLTKQVLEMHHIYNEQILEELISIGQQMVSGQIPMPGQQGSQPGVPTQNPATTGAGAAAGINNVRGGLQ